MVDYKDGYYTYDTDWQQVYNAIRGYGVIPGYSGQCSCSIVPGTSAITYSAGLVNTSGGTKSINAGSITLSSLQDGTYRRKVLIYVDADDGTVKADEGSASAASAAGNDFRAIKYPSPPDYNYYDLDEGDVVLSEVWLNTTGVSLSLGDISDRRYFLGVSPYISVSNASTIPLSIKGASGQTADYINIKDYSGNELFSIDSNGDAFYNNLIQRSITYSKSLISSCETAAEWTGGDVDTSVMKFGKGSIKLTSTNLVEETSVLETDLDLRWHTISFHLYTPDATVISSFKIQLQVNSSWSTYFECSDLLAVDGGDDGEWKHIILTKSRMTRTGVTLNDLGSITAIRFSLTADSGETAYVYFDHIEKVPNLPQGMVTFTFDDANTAVTLSTTDAVKALGFKGVSCIPSDSLSGATLTAANILQNLGWDIISHSKTHGYGLNPAEMSLSQNVLINNGFSKGARFMAYDGGAYNAEYHQAAKDCYAMARATGGVGTSSFPPGEYHKLPATLIDSLTAEQIETYVSDAMYCGEWLICYAHDWSTAIADTIEWMHENGYPIVSFSDVWDSLMWNYSVADERASKLVGCTDSYPNISAADSNAICDIAGDDANFVSPTACHSCDEGAYTNETTAATNDTADDMTLFPTSAVANDAYYFGYSSKFYGMRLIISTTAVYAKGSSCIWEYWNGSEWSDATTLLTDGTSSGTQIFYMNGPIYFDAGPPDDWATTTVNSVSAYYLRARFVSGTINTPPRGQRVYIIPTLSYTSKTTGITNPDYPRAIQFTLSASSEELTQDFDIIISGSNGPGENISDTQSWQTGVYQKPFSRITSITYPNLMVSADTLSVGTTDKIGLTNHIFSSNDLLRTTINGTSSSPSLSLQYQSLDCSTIVTGYNLVFNYRTRMFLRD